MTVRQVLRYYGQLKGRSLAQLDPVIKTWLERLQLADWADKKVQTLSKGMSQKVQFISAIVSQPKLLILDEPFSGLDPVNADALRDAVLELRRAGHDDRVLDARHGAPPRRMCDRIFMIFKGNKVLDGSLDEIQSQLRPGHRARADGAPARRRSPGCRTSTVVHRHRQLSGRAAARAIRRRFCSALVAEDARATTSR